MNGSFTKFVVNNQITLEVETNQIFEFIEQLNFPVKFLKVLEQKIYYKNRRGYNSKFLVTATTTGEPTHILKYIHYSGEITLVNKFTKADIDHSGFSTHRVWGLDVETVGKDVIGLCNEGNWSGGQNFSGFVLLEPGTVIIFTRKNTEKRFEITQNFEWKEVS